ALHPRDHGIEQRIERVEVPKNRARAQTHLLGEAASAERGDPARPNDVQGGVSQLGLALLRGATGLREHALESKCLLSNVKPVSTGKVPHAKSPRSRAGGRAWSKPCAQGLRRKPSDSFCPPRCCNMPRLKQPAVSERPGRALSGSARPACTPQAHVPQQWRQSRDHWLELACREPAVPCGSARSGGTPNCRCPGSKRRLVTETTVSAFRCRRGGVQQGTRNGSRRAR